MKKNKIVCKNTKITIFQNQGGNAPPLPTPNYVPAVEPQG